MNCVQNCCAVSVAERMVGDMRQFNDDSDSSLDGGEFDFEIMIPSNNAGDSGSDDGEFHFEVMRPSNDGEDSGTDDDELDFKVRNPNSDYEKLADKFENDSFNSKESFLGRNIGVLIVLLILVWHLGDYIDFGKLISLPFGKTFVDMRDLKLYRKIKIGKQVWMAENLNHSMSGCKSFTTRKRRRAPDEHAYAKLYDWDMAHNACPEGWRLPGNDDWDKLIDYVGGQEIAGTKLKFKKSRVMSWNGADEYGFSALPGGFYNNGNLNDFHSAGFWWSATEYDDENAFIRHVHGGLTSMNRGNAIKTAMMSVRCIKY